MMIFRVLRSVSVIKTGFAAPFAADNQINLPVAKHQSIFDLGGGGCSILLRRAGYLFGLRTNVLRRRLRRLRFSHSDSLLTPATGTTAAANRRAEDKIYRRCCCYGHLNQIRSTDFQIPPPCIRPCTLITSELSGLHSVFFTIMKNGLCHMSGSNLE
jgi:hypothetical protein